MKFVDVDRRRVGWPSHRPPPAGDDDDDDDGRRRRIYGRAVGQLTGRSDGPTAVRAMDTVGLASVRHRPVALRLSGDRPNYQPRLLTRNAGQ